MAGAKPIVYILHGEDEFGIAQTLADLESRLGDPSSAGLNTTRLDGNTYNLDQLLSVAGAMPFLADRRIVILTNPLARLGNKAAREKFLKQLEQIPPTTAMVLVEHSLLTSERERKKNNIHWLEKWGISHPERCLIKTFLPPKGDVWISSVRAIAQKAGGEISPGAAEHLYSLVDGDLRLADQEVLKLLAYVNYRRKVEIDDVDTLTADVGQGDIFAMVDALGNRDGRKALGMLRRLLEYQDYYTIFGMVVRQFRQLVQVRAILDSGGGKDEIVRVLRLYNMQFVADRLIAQARRFTQEGLKLIYHKLLDVDLAVKTSQMEGDLALETLVAALTT
jgi:DNA polymerase-3 subunit delta